MMNLPQQYTYLSVENNENHKIYRVKELVCGSTAEAWVEEFAKESYVTWRVMTTYPNAGRKNVFRKDYRCQHSTDKRATGAGPSKNTDCPATLVVIVKRYVKNTRAKNVDSLTKEYPGMIILKGEHNHPIICAESLKHRDMAPETKDKLITLFRQGHNPSSAHYFLNMDLMMNSEEDYYKVSADGRYLPTLSTVAKLFEKEFEADYGKISGEEMFKNLKAFLVEYEKSGGKAKCNRTIDNHYYVVICTPLMLRAHKKVSQAGDLVLLDASGGMDKQRHRLYAFVTPTAAGGIPLGIIVTDCEKEDVFTEALVRFKELVSEDAFFSKHYPKVFLTDNDMKERNALNKVFPQSNLLLCQFHMLKSMWSWLCNKKHNINNNHRQELYFLFKNVVYAFDEALANEASTTFQNKVKQYGYSNLSNHFNNLWDIRNDWVSCFRKNLQVRGSNTTNYVEIVFRILKDIIFDRVLAYNITQLVDFIVTKYEMYMRQRLVSFASGCYSNALLLKMLPQKCDLTLFNISFDENEDVFHVIHMNTVYVVDVVKGICSCSIGSSGKLCKHSSAVFLSLEHSSTAYNIANKETKALMLFVAEGLNPNDDWFKPLQSEGKPIQTSAKTKANIAPVLQNMDPESMEITHDVTPAGSNNIPFVTEEEMTKYKALLHRIEQGLSSKPNVMVPAFKKMLKNVDRYASTESGLASAMHTFGAYSGVKSASQRAAKTLIKRSHRSVIGVQPTAPARRKLLLSGRRKLTVGQPTGSTVPCKELSQHDYTSLGALPKRKKKAPHNLEQCVCDNKSLGGN